MVQFTWYIFKIKLHFTKNAMYWKIFHIDYQPANDWWPWPISAPISSLQHSETLWKGVSGGPLELCTSDALIHSQEPGTSALQPTEMTWLGDQHRMLSASAPQCARQELCWLSGKLITATLELLRQIIPHITSHELLPPCPYTSPPLSTARFPQAGASPSWQQHRQQGECWEWQPR